MSSTPISAASPRSDVVAVPTATRAAAPAGAPAFRDLVARGAGAVARGAERAVTALPGAPVVAAALRQGPALSTPTSLAPARGVSTLAGGVSAESPSGAAGVATTAGEAGSVESALAQSQEFNMYYLQLQEQMAAENRSYSAMSNVLKARHDTIKNAIGNIR